MKKSNFEKDIEESFEAPAKILEKGVELAEKGEKELLSKKPFKRAEEYWSTLGPGLTTGAADNDPSGIITYSQSGARFGFQLIWLPLFSYPFMAAVQEMCARIGIVSGKGLAANIRHNFSAPVLYSVTGLLFFANTLNIAADLGAMAASAQLLIPSSSLEVLVIVFALISLGLQLFTTYARYAKYLKYLALALLSYVVVALSVGLNWGDVIQHTLIPSFTFTKEHVFLLAAILGTTISPYLFFWQTSQEVEEGISRGENTIIARKREVSAKNIKRMRIDVWSGMFFSNLIAFFIFAAFAGTLFAAGETNISTAAEAAAALAPFGMYATWLFSIGIIGTGLLAVPVLAGSTAYAISESFGWKYGLHRKLKQAYSFYGVIIVSMVIGIIANLLQLDPIKGLIYAAVANGVIAPFIIFFVLRISGNKKIMGEYVNRPITRLFGWSTIILMALSGIAAIVSLWW